MTVTLPAGSAGPVSVIATNPSGASNAVTFTYTSPLSRATESRQPPAATPTLGVTARRYPAGRSVCCDARCGNRTRVSASHLAGLRGDSPSLILRWA